MSTRLRLSHSILAAIVAALFAWPALAAAADDPASKIEPGLDASEGFWVVFDEEADLDGAASIDNWDRRGEAVVDELKDTAKDSQGGVRAELRADGVDFDPFYLVNAIRVYDGSEDLARELAQRKEVAEIIAPRTYTIPKPTAGEVEKSVNAVEWGIAAINADDAWSTFGARGEGIVVANIDTGVQFDHPALAGAYRGRLANGQIDHNYNWFDPSHVCGDPTPCDNNGHGTHTMGTMVGDDGAGNQIGVAPGARWIAAKGCEARSCSDTALLAAGQWILAPTDLNGANPRPDLRPDIVNNSWGGGGQDPWYQATVDAWRAAGIFPAFSNGNSGPGCNSAGSPGDYASSYATGAFDAGGAIASFSSRGSGFGGGVKPNIAAPGVNVRSSVPGSGYAAFNGTSMASPHTAGTVALMWSAAPALKGDLDQTAEILDETATDTSDLSCGGTADDNNVFGEGKLNAFAAVQASPRGATGRLGGTVTDAASAQPVADAALAIRGTQIRNRTSGADGTYSVPVAAGDYTVTASRFGYASSSASATVSDGATTTLDLAMTPLARHTVSGRVRNADREPVAGATVALLDTPLPAVTTGPDGSYSIPNVPVGHYDLKASTTPAGCDEPQARDLTVDGEESVDFDLSARRDSFGYRCRTSAGGYIEGDTPVALAGDDVQTTIPLPFSFPLYGQGYDQASVSSNGNVGLLAGSPAFDNTPLPRAAAPNAAIYPFWDDLYVDANAQVLTRQTGTAPNRQFVVEWRNAAFFGAPDLRVDFEVALSENGRISFRYRNLDPAQARERGGSATVGIENAAGDVALEYSLNEPGLADGRSIDFVPPGVFPATDVLDTFDRANGAIGGSWRGLTLPALYRIAGNRLDVGLGGPIVWNDTFGPTQEAYVTLSVIDARSSSQGLLLKVQDGGFPDAGAITAVYDARARALRVTALRVGARSWTVYPALPADFANGDQLGARVSDSGVVRLYRNGNELVSVTLSAADQAFFNPRGGKIGISTLAATDALLDDFGGGAPMS